LFFGVGMLSKFQLANFFPQRLHYLWFSLQTAIKANELEFHSSFILAFLTKRILNHCKQL
jgi:hypothetical protein